MIRPLCLPDIWYPQKYFLPLPVKRTVPLPELSESIKQYIAEHFKDTHPDTFSHDLNRLSNLRREWVEGERGPEVHVRVVDGLML